MLHTVENLPLANAFKSSSNNVSIVCVSWGEFEHYESSLFVLFYILVQMFLLTAGAYFEFSSGFVTCISLSLSRFQLNCCVNVKMETFKFT